MPYAPSPPSWSPSPSDYTAGQSWAGAISSLGNSASRAIDMWKANDKQDSLTRSQVAALLPSYADKLTNPEDKKIAEKFLNHKTDYKDNGYLLGLFSTLKNVEEDKQKQNYIASQNALIQQQLQTQQRAEAQRKAAMDNVTLAENVQKNPFIFNNQANARGQAIAADPQFTAAQSAMRFSGAPLTPEASAHLAGIGMQGIAKPALKVQTVHSTNEKGEPVIVSVDAISGRELGRAPVMPQAGTPEQQAKTASLVEQAKKTAEDSQKFLTEISDNAESSRVRASAVKRINALYDAGATTGFGQGGLTQMQSAFARVGLGKDGIANQQQLNKELSNLVLETGRDLMKGGGSVSNYERGAIADATANPSLDPAANRRILSVISKVAERNVALDRKRQELDEQGLPPVEIARELRKLRDSMPVGVETLPGGETIGKFKILSVQ